MIDEPKKKPTVNSITTAATLITEEIATFGEDHVYNQADAAGFINLYGLPIKVKAQVDAKNADKK